MATKRPVKRGPEAKAFRAERVVREARRLASTGGYDAVQMREVAKRADVSLVTLYRYYPSKDDLILAMLYADLAILRQQVLEGHAQQGSPRDRVAAVYVHVFRAMTQDRGYTHASMSRYHTPRAFDSAPTQDDTQVRTAFVDIVALAAWGPDHEKTETEYMALHVLESLLQHCLVSWLDSGMPADYFERRLVFAAEHLLDDELVLE